MDPLRRTALANDAPGSERLLEFSPQPLGPEETTRLPISNRWLWFGSLGGPVAWAIHLMVVYPLTEVACRFETKLPLYGASAALFGAAALAGIVSWSYVRYMQRHDGATVPRRVRFMASAGLAAAVLFMILIVGGTLPVIFDDPCQLQGQRRPTLLPHL